VKSWKQNLAAALAIGVALTFTVTDEVRDRSRETALQDELRQADKRFEMAMRDFGQQRRHQIVVRAKQQLAILALLDAKHVNPARQSLIVMLEETEKELLRHDPARESEEEKETIADTKQRIAEYLSRTQYVTAP
jgi:hypothetical protein